MTIEAIELVKSMRVADIIKRNYAWSLHKTWISEFASIRDQGLEPFRDYIPGDQRILTALGEEGLSVVFFTPLGADNPTNPVGKRSEDTRQAGDKNFFLALAIGDLPLECGLDWVMRHGWIVQLLNKGSASDEEIFKLINEFGSFVVYGLIPPELLRVRAVGCAPDDPSTWPLLTEVSPELIFVL